MIGAPGSGKTSLCSRITNVPVPEVSSYFTQLKIKGSPIDFVNKYDWISPEIQIDHDDNNLEEDGVDDSKEISFKFSLWDFEDPYRDAIKQMSLVHKTFPLVLSSQRTLIGWYLFEP